MKKVRMRKFLDFSQKNMKKCQKMKNYEKGQRMRKMEKINGKSKKSTISEFFQDKMERC
jgi:hypothetical protein